MHHRPVTVRSSRRVKSRGVLGSFVGAAIGALVIVALAAATASAVTYSWDPNVTGGATLGGTGTWDAGTTNNWWDSSANVVWPTSGTDNDAVFGGTAGTVTVATGGVTVNDMTFSATGYTVGGGTLTFNGAPLLTTPGAGTSATINSAITSAVGLTINGSGTLNLGGVASMSAADLNLGTTTAGNTLIIANGGKVQYTTNQFLKVGNVGSSNDNLLHVSTPGSAASSADWSLRVGQVRIGEGSTGNELRVSNGAYMRRETASNAQATWQLGVNAGANNNRMIVTGTNSVATMVGSQALRQFLNVGVLGSQNYLRVENGGTATMFRFAIATDGDSATGGGDDNYILVTGSGSTFNVPDSQGIAVIGAIAGATGNNFRVENGATATWSGVTQTNRPFQVGGGTLVANTGNGSNNNYLLVTGASSQLTLGNVRPLSIGGRVVDPTNGGGTPTIADCNVVGNIASDNEVRVYDGGTLSMSTMSMYVMGVNSAFRLGNGGALASATVGTSSGAGVVAGVFLKNADGRLYVDNGRLSRTTSGLLASGPGQVVLSGAGYFSMPTGTLGEISSVISGAGSFTKEGAGNLLLSALNSYTGNTSVLDGELQLSQAFLSDSSNVLLSGSGFLRLNYSGTDTINSLYLDGVQQAPGVYDVSNLGDWIDGTGSLTVITGVPEPGYLAVAAMGGLAAALLARRRRRAA